MSSLAGILPDQVAGDGTRLVEYEAVLILEDIHWSVGTGIEIDPSTYDHVGDLPEGLLGNELRKFLFAFAKIDRDKLEVDILLLADEGDKPSAGRFGVSVEFNGHGSCNSKLGVMIEH